MTLGTQTTLTIHLTTEEEQAFRVVDKVLRQLQDTYIPQASFEAYDNGEIFQINELSRVRGVLSTVSENTHFYMKTK